MGTRFNVEAMGGTPPLPLPPNTSCRRSSLQHAVTRLSMESGEPHWEEVGVVRG